MKNRLPNVFVSSTMYDLSEFRAQLRQFVVGLGWRAVMSEHDSFPVDPDSTTVENCRQNVRENADVFVMVVGARYGSIDEDTDMSITNLEFVEARSRGVPAYVFISRDVIAQLPLWKLNPDANFSSVVDTPRIFEFIDHLRRDGEAWTFEFVTAEDIVNTLRQQFAFLVQDALELRKATGGQERLLSELEGEPLKLALQRGDYWEIRLFATVLEEELDRRATLRRDIDHRLSSGPMTFVEIGDVASWAQDRLSECIGLARTGTRVLNDYLPEALAEDGEPVDPIDIVAVARRLAQVWEDNARWTLRCRSVRVDDRAKRLVDLLSNANANMLNEIWEFGHTLIPRLDEAIQALASGGPSRLELTLTLTADVDELSDEIPRFERELYG